MNNIFLKHEGVYDKNPIIINFVKTVFMVSSKTGATGIIILF